MNGKTMRVLSYLSFVLGFASVLGAIAMWSLSLGESPDRIGHAERFGIFVGLWAPTFFGLAACLRVYAAGDVAGAAPIAGRVEHAA